MAVQRNAVPDAVKIPVQRINAADLQFLHHAVSYSEYTGFAQPKEELTRNLEVRPLIVGCVTIDWKDEFVGMVFQYNCKCGGAPNRNWARQTFSIAPGEWGQIVYNGRFQYSDDGYWYYEKWCVNVALTERITPGMFTQSEPSYRFAAIGHLY